MFFEMDFSTTATKDNLAPITAKPLPVVAEPTGESPLITNADGQPHANNITTAVQPVVVDVDPAQPSVTAAPAPPQRKRKQNRNRRDRRQKLNNGNNATVQTLSVLMDRIVEICAADEKNELMRNLRPLVDAAANLARSLATGTYIAPSAPVRKDNKLELNNNNNNNHHHPNKSANSAAASPTTTELTAPTACTAASPVKLTDYEMNIFSSVVRQHNQGPFAGRSQVQHQQQQHQMSNQQQTGIAAAAAAAHNFSHVLMPGSQIPPYVYKPLMDSRQLLQQQVYHHQQQQQQQRLMMMQNMENGGSSSSNNTRRAREINTMMTKLMSRQKKSSNNNKQYHEAVAKERAEAEVRSRLREAKIESDYKTILSNAEALGMEHETQVIKSRLNSFVSTA